MSASVDSPTMTEFFAQPSASPQATPTDLILLIFIHGFKGTDSTFGEFPQRLQHILTESIKDTVVESIVFPAYETKGDLKAAVVRFSDWLTELTVRQEVANGGAGKAKVVLCGHSMGGLLAADALIEFYRNRPDKFAPLWPKIVACIAFDTPYLGIHPHVFKNTATQATEYIRTATSVLNSFRTWRSKTPSGAAAAAAASSPLVTIPAQAPASSEAPKSPNTPESPTTEAAGGASLWQKWSVPAAIAAGSVLLTGAAGAAYYKRDELGVGYTWVTDHLKYVGNLWDRAEMEGRLDKLFEIEGCTGVLFQTFYTDIPPTPPAFLESRTFTILPNSRSPFATRFAPNHNTRASDEIQAHTGMFDSKTNDGYYDLGLSAARLIREAVLLHRKREATATSPVVPPKSQPQLSEQIGGNVSPSEPVSVVETEQKRTTISTATIVGGAAATVVTTAVVHEAITTEKPSLSERSAPVSTAAEDEESEEESDEGEEDEDEDDETHLPVMEGPHEMAVAETGASTARGDEDEDEDEDEESEEADDDEEEEEGDDDDDDDDEEEDGNDDEEEDEDEET